jgi:hypothetical protein
MKEIWKDIPGFEAVYQVSNKGRIKSFKKDPKGKIASLTNKKGDYFTFALCYNGLKRSVRIHQLVVEAFLGIRSSPKLNIHHLDGNKQNNCIDNLSIMASRTHALIESKTNEKRLNGMNNYNKVIKTIPIQQYDLNGNLIAEFRNGRDAHVSTGVCHRNILQVASKTEYKPGMVRKQAGGYVWKLKTATL